MNYEVPNKRVKELVALNVVIVPLYCRYSLQWLTKKKTHPDSTSCAKNRTYVILKRVKPFKLHDVEFLVYKLFFVNSFT